MVPLFGALNHLLKSEAIKFFDLRQNFADSAIFKWACLSLKIRFTFAVVKVISEIMLNYATARSRTHSELCCGTIRVRPWHVGDSIYKDKLKTTT